MITTYNLENNHLGAALGLPAQAKAGATCWIDLLQPSQTDIYEIEKLMGITLPTREEMQELEVSERLYQESGAAFMTVTAIAQEAEEPVNVPVSFVLKGETLVTLRYADLRAFTGFSQRAQRSGATPCANGEQVMLGLIEALCDRMAEALKRVGTDIDGISRTVFRHKTRQKAAGGTQDLQAIIEQIGQNGDLLTNVRESLVSINRVLSYHTAVDQGNKKRFRETLGRIKTLYRDVVALGDQATFLSGKINFLLDATLGLINLQQNQIIKIFSVAAVVFLPPTLVASAYGMNFEHMPELRWTLGYPWAICMMIASSILPYIYFKRRGWL